MGFPESLKRDIGQRADFLRSLLPGGRVFPVTIISDRYTGAYSGGRWTAWLLYSDGIPDAVYSDDVSCMEFWTDEAKEWVGIGDTPDAAHQDLLKKLDKNLP